MQDLAYCSAQSLDRDGAKGVPKDDGWKQRGEQIVQKRMKTDDDALRTKLRWLLTGLTVLVYWQVASFSFINYDDPNFVSSNPHVFSGVSFANAIWSFSTLSGGITSYQPLVWMTHQLDCQLFGLHPGPQHLTNLWFHVANTLLLFTLLDRLTGAVWRSATVAALFALHPLHVETVAWISERKSLVCVFFWLIATLAYVQYARRRNFSSYVLVFLFGAAALLSKPIAVSMPITLLLLDFWPLGRLGKDEVPQEGISGENKEETLGGKSAGNASIFGSPRSFLFGSPFVEKAPLFILTGIICLVTVAAQRDTGATQSLQDVPMGVRVSNGIVACVLYLRKTIWPVDLAPIYPLRHDWCWWQVAGSALFLLVISGFCACHAKRRGYLIAGWVWYLATLFPTLGLVQVGLQGMADRYSYVPLIGIFLSLAWSFPDHLVEGPVARRLAWGAGTGVVTVCSVCTFATARHWHDSLHLFQDAVQVTSSNYVAYCQLGAAFEATGNLPEAERLFRESLKIKPDQFVTQVCLGQTLFQKGDSCGAFEQYSRAMKLRPADATVHGIMAELLFSSTDPRVHDLQKALQQERLACDLAHYRNGKLLTDLATISAESGAYIEASDAAQRSLALAIAPEEVEESKKLIANVKKMEGQARERSQQATVEKNRK